MTSDIDGLQGRFLVVTNYMEMIKGGIYPPFLRDVDHSYGLYMYVPYLGVFLGIDAPKEIFLL